MFLTNDGGASWAAPAALPNNGLSLSYISFDTADPNIVYVASVAPFSTATHLWKSTNFGASWTAIDGGDFPTGVPVNAIRNDSVEPEHALRGHPPRRVPVRRRRRELGPLRLGHAAGGGH